jgi:anthranilate phosphoribosyltransferase
VFFAFFAVNNFAVLKHLIATLNDRTDLTDGQVAEAVAALIREDVPVAEKSDFLIALSAKGETPAEIAAFVRQLRSLSITPELDPATRAQEILDVCGTGGDKLNTFNISTTVAFVAAAAGITVAKHGNRAITSQSGSADVLEELGIPVTLTPEQAARSLRDQQFAFFFAPNYHPAFKHIAPARKLSAERGHRTIFNFLGPLLNPVRPTAQLLGVPRPELCEPLARVLQQLGARRVMVVSGNVGQGFLDELSTIQPTSIAEYYHDRGFNTSTLDPVHFGFAPARLEDLRGGDRKSNAYTLRQILEGKERGPKRDAVLLNSGAALFVGGKANSLTIGIDMAAELIDSGKASEKLEALIKYRP